MKNTKAEIIESAEELISSLEFQLTASEKKLIDQKEYLKIVTILLAITFILAPIIY